MRLINFEIDGHGKYGVASGDAVIDLSARLGGTYPTLLSLIERNGIGAAHAAIGQEGPRYDLSAVKILKPFGNAGRIFCVGLNYPKPHPLGGEVAAPSYPSLFMKTPEALVAHDECLEAPAVSSQLDYEAELTIVIGRPGRAIAPEKALAHVAGYTCMNDGSVRDYQGHSVWAGKNFFRSGAIGPWIVTADEIPDPGALRIASRLNGREVQAASTGEMFFTVPAIIAYLSMVTPLRAGDMIATGSPSGTGATQSPPRFLASGDRLEVEIDRIGTLMTTVGAAVTA